MGGVSCIEPYVFCGCRLNCEIVGSGSASREAQVATGSPPNQLKVQTRNCRGCCCSHAMRGDNNRYYPVLKIHPIELPNQAHFHSVHCKLYRFLQPLPLPTTPLRVGSSSLQSGRPQLLSTWRVVIFCQANKKTRPCRCRPGLKI